MFNTASGVRIPFPEKIEEKYMLDGNWMNFNISFEKLNFLFEDFLKDLCEPLFLFIHLPLLQNEEKELLQKGSNSFHSEVLYLDGQTKNQICEIMQQYGEILLNDGMSQFGIASHKTKDELYIQKYKMVGIYSKEIDKYINLMDKYKISETDHLITAWNTFSQEHPGECSPATFNENNIYDVVELLKEKGMYRAKVVDS
jgi:hypothetical protein